MLTGGGTGVHAVAVHAVGLPRHTSIVTVLAKEEGRARAEVRLQFGESAD